ncbi:MAG TPA: response regulator [Verrucomicrobiae bacterium]|nr:response regulator [Verrucomicrobiae bacterium]
MTGTKAGGKIVVADDDPIVLKFLAALLKDAGYEVTTAEDGEKALSRIREAQPDLVIMDLVMPYHDGFEITRSLRNSPATRQLPIIILSMKDRESDVLRCFELGADDYIRKPFNALELLARVKKILDRRPAGA